MHLIISCEEENNPFEKKKEEAVSILFQGNFLGL